MSKTFVMDRRGTDAVFDGEISIKIPDNQSAFSLIGSGNEIHDGDDYTIDEHWIVNKTLGYNRKKFRRIGGSTGPLVWSKHLTSEYLSEIEIRYRTIDLKHRNFYETFRNKAIGELQKVKKAHVSINKDADLDHVWEYNIENIIGCDLSFSRDWVKKPKKMRNVRLGNTLYEMEKKCKTLEDRAWKFYEAFMECCRQYIHKNCKLYTNNRSPYETMICLIKINDIDYAFECSRRRGISLLCLDRLPNVSK